jgi:hypothetical protein
MLVTWTDLGLFKHVLTISEVDCVNCDVLNITYYFTVQICQF